MKIFVLTLLLCSATLTLAGQNSNSRQALWCSYSEIENIHDKILKTGRNDKFMHCSVSCQLGIQCGSFFALNLGILKEAWDVVSPGDASYDDLIADYKGLELYLTRAANSDQSCIDECSDIYPE